MIISLSRRLEARSDNSRLLLGGCDPVKKPGLGESADPFVAAFDDDPV